jgi:O-antigen ligase
MVLLFGLWTLVLTDVHWFVASFAGSPVLRIVTVAFLALLFTLLAGAGRPSWQQRYTPYWPFLMYAASSLPMMLFAVNTGFARTGAKTLFLWWIFIIGSVVIVDSVRRAELLLKMYGLQFLWWAVWAGPKATIGWHHSLDNHDAIGAFMVGGLSMSFFLFLASPKGTRFKKAMLVSSFLCVMVVVASYARGAFLAAVAVYGIMWLRSPRKGLTLMAGVGMAVVVVLAAVLIFPAGFFYNEIMSSFTEGTTSGTGSDRWVLWQVGWEVFKEHPIFGVGIGNVGAYGSTIFQPGELGADYYFNPGLLYGKALHNVYVTTLSEQGIFGSVAFLWVLFDFWRRNRVLRSGKFDALWRSMGGELSLKQVALGLELGMVSVMITALLYPMLNIHFWFTLLTLNLLLHRLVTAEAKRVGTPLAPAGRAAQARRPVSASSAARRHLA